MSAPDHPRPVPAPHAAPTAPALIPPGSTAPALTTPVSRRAFIQTAGALSAAAAITPGFVPISRAASARVGHIAGSDAIKIGLIGCGGRGTGAALQALRADKGVVLWSMGDVFQDRVDASHAGLVGELSQESPSVAEQRIQCPAERRFVAFDAYKQVIDSGVDAVLLTSYPNFRPAHLEYAVAAGKHVFAEKPVAVDSTGARTFLAAAAAAKQKNLACMVGFCWRYNDGMRATFERINAGAIGDVTTVHTTYHTSTLTKRPRQPQWSDMEFQFRNWWHFTWISGDHIVEQAVHSVDRMAWAMNDAIPVRCTALGGRAAREGPEHGNVYDHFTVIYEYADGRRAFHTCRQIDQTPSDNTDYVYATAGSAIINGWKPTYALTGPRTPAATTGANAGAPSGLTWNYSGPKDRDMYQTEHDELFASIRAGKPINDAERGARSCLMAIMGRMAAYTGATVTWEQALNSTEDLQPKSLAWGAAPAVEVAIPGKTKLV